jgi:cytochrome c551/c552
MSRSLKGLLSTLFVPLLCAVSVSAYAQSKPASSEGPRFGFGHAPTTAEIAGWDIDVRPDGHGIRKGKGTVAHGQELYDAKCAMCHGTFGESNRYMVIAGGVKPDDLRTGRAAALKAPDGPRTVGTKLNYATTLWDYINRAMPWTNPQSLTTDEVYAITAYVLNLNEIVPAEFELNDQSITKVRMPNRNGMTTNHGMLSVNGKPDVQGSSCMKDCVKEVKVTSDLPAFARNQHGNLAEQSRPLGPTRGIDTTRYDPAQSAGRGAVVIAAASPALVDPKALLAQKACTGCHGLTNKVVGPGFNDVAARYQDKTDAVSYLVRKIKSGGEGVWGSVPMPPQTALRDDDAHAIATWIAGGAK